MMQSLTTLETVDQLHAWAVDLTLDPPEDRRWRFRLQDSPDGSRLVPSVSTQGRCPPSQWLSETLTTLIAPHWRAAGKQSRRPARTALEIVQIVSGSAGVRAVEAEAEATAHRCNLIEVLIRRVKRCDGLRWGWETEPRDDLEGASYWETAIGSAEGLARVRELLAPLLAAVEPWRERVCTIIWDTVTALVGQQTDHRAQWASRETREHLTARLLDEACLAVGSVLDSAAWYGHCWQREDWGDHVERTGLLARWRDLEKAYGDRSTNWRSARYASLADRLVDLAMAEYLTTSHATSSTAVPEADP